MKAIQHIKFNQIKLFDFLRDKKSLASSVPPESHERSATLDEPFPGKLLVRVLERFALKCTVMKFTSQEKAITKLAKVAKTYDIKT